MAFTRQLLRSGRKCFQSCMNTWTRPYSSDGVPGSSYYVVPLPKLSPTMSAGTLSAWLKEPGDKVHVHDLLFEVTTEELVEEAYRMGDFAGKVTLLIESQEEGYLGPIFAKLGSTLPVGTPIALFAEDKQTLEKLYQMECPNVNIYDAPASSVKCLPWQSYLKESSKTDTGCM